MNKPKETPLEKLIRLKGSQRAAAKALGVNESTISRYLYEQPTFHFMLKMARKEPEIFPSVASIVRDYEALGYYLKE